MHPEEGKAVGFGFTEQKLSLFDVATSKPPRPSPARRFKNIRR